jgi:DNA-binding transcriptional MerR regulator
MKEKKYFVQDVMKELGIARRTIYNWERTKKIPKPKRDPMSNYRYWTEKDVNLLKRLSGRG